MKNTVLWEASRSNLEASHLWAFKQHLEKKFNLNFQNYEELHLWSVKYYQSFWRECLHATGVLYEGSSDFVFKEKPGCFYGGTWFPDVKLNYAENLLARLSNNPLASFYEDNQPLAKFSREELLGAVRFFQNFFMSEGMKAGDRVCAFVGNNHLAIIAFLAVNSLGGVWASASPDFGEQGVLDRFEQVEPAVYLYDESTVYNEKTFDLREKSIRLAKALGQRRNLKSFSLREIYRSYLEQKPALKLALFSEIRFTRLPFQSPLYVLFSSGTTGAPKCLLHSSGGVLLQHSKELLLHGNLRSAERFFYYTSTGWMMWNWMVSGLFAGADLYTLEGAAMKSSWSLWDFVREYKIDAFGTSARFLAACRSRQITSKGYLPRITFSTGSPLLPEDFDYYYSAIDPGRRSQLASISGGTDIVSCFMLGNPWKAVRRGEIQAAGLGMDVASFDESGRALRGREGELICRTPFPSMPIAFLNDPKNEKFEKAYFKRFPGVWHHGDFVTMTPDGGFVMHGRSDATLNPAGVRIGTAEIYRVVEQEPEVADSLAVGKVVEGDERVVLFVKLREGTLGEDLVVRLKKSLREKASPRHVPDYVFSVSDIPYTLSGKKVELAVKLILKGEAPKNTEALQNPGCLKEFEKFRSLGESQST